MHDIATFIFLGKNHSIYSGVMHHGIACDDSEKWGPYFCTLYDKVLYLGL